MHRLNHQKPAPPVPLEELRAAPVVDALDELRGALAVLEQEHGDPL